MIKFIIVIWLSGTSLLNASEALNEWINNWPFCSSPGKFTITKAVVPNQTDIQPLGTNILIQKFSIRNSIGSTNTYPFLSSIRIDMIGSAEDSDVSNVHLFFDSDGIWNNNNEKEFLTNIIRNQITGQKFSRNYSPVQFENEIATFGELGVDELQLHLPWSNTYYFYITIDMKRKVTDKATIDFRIYGVKMFMNCRCYWDQNMENVDTDINARINVHATRLEISGEPPAPGINVDTPFSIRVRALDNYGNLDKEYTGTIYFICTDPNAVLPYTETSKYTFTLADEGEKIFNNFRLFRGPKENITVSDGVLGLNDDITSDIIVLAEVDHYMLTAGWTNHLPFEPVVTAGQPLSSISISTLTVTAFNYLSSIIPDYTGRIYFHSSANGKYDRFPAGISNPYQFTGIGNDDGSHDFQASQFILTKAGKQNLIVSDLSGNYTGEWLNITVIPSSYAKLTIDCETNINANSYLDLTIHAADQYENTIAGQSTFLVFELERIKKYSSQPIRAFYPQKNILLSGGTLELKDEEGIIINEGGKYRLTIRDVNNPNITVYKNLYINTNPEGDQNSAVSYNYIKPDSTQAVDIYYNNKTSAAVTLETGIYTLNGKCIKKFEKQIAQPGMNRLQSWEINNDDSQQVASGTYIVIIKNNDQIEKHFIIVVK